MRSFTFTLLAMAAFLLVCTVRVRRGAMRMMKNRTLISDQGEGAWTVEWASLWLVHFSRDWRDQYGSTWAFGIGNEDVWHYYPRASE